MANDNPTIIERVTNPVSSVESPSEAPPTIDSITTSDKQFNRRLIPSNIKAVLFNFFPDKSVCQMINKTRKKDKIIHINIVIFIFLIVIGKSENITMVLRTALSEIFAPELIPQTMHRYK